MAQYDNHPLVTIILPAYNAEETITKTIQSVVDQSYSNWELIIVDDGSTDGTCDVVRFFAEKEQRIKHHERDFPSGRPAVPRNHAIRLAKGELIAFLDSDDIWLPRKIEKQAALMVNCRDIALSYVLNSRLYRNGTVNGEYPDPKFRYTGYAYEKFYLHNSIANSGVMVRKAVFDTIGLLDEDPKLAFVEDADMWLRIAREYPVDYVPGEILLLYRVKQERLSIRQALLKIRGRMRIARKHYAHAGVMLFLRKMLTTPFRESIGKRIPMPRVRKESVTL